MLLPMYHRSPTRWCGARAFAIRAARSVVLICTFWAFLFLPGYAFIVRRARPLLAAGLLATIAYAYVASFVMLAPVSLLCYAFGAKLSVFSSALVLLVLAACVVLARSQGFWEFRRQLRGEPIVAWLLLFGLLCLQARLGGWLDGDATFHIGRMRVLLEHGFTNRDIYLSEYHFQRIYHSNLLFPVYASAARLTHKEYLEAWFYSEAWAKLLIAAGHYVLGYTLTQRRSTGYLLAVCMITLNAGETYALYPNTLCVGWLLPMMLALGWKTLSQPTRSGALWMTAIAFVLAQVHALYAVYAGLVLGPLLALAWLVPQSKPQRVLRTFVLLSFIVAVPFVLVSSVGLRDEPELSSAPAVEELEQPAPAPRSGIVNNADPRVRAAPAIAAGGGHLEKMLYSPEEGVFVFKPEYMGGERFVIAGLLGLALALLLATDRRLPFAGALLASLMLAGLLFTERGTGWALLLLHTPFVVARLSTILTSLLVLGLCASATLLLERVPQLRLRRAAEVVVLVVAFLISTRTLGHAPKTFQEHVRAAIARRSERHAALRALLKRRKLLRELPRGTTVLTTARFARQVVMLRDCYVIAADRGHTAILGIDRRRRDLVFMNAELTPWDVRKRLIESYDLHWVTFERRWRRRYRWAYDHGHVRASGAGQEVIELDR